MDGVVFVFDDADLVIAVSGECQFYVFQAWQFFISGFVNDVENCVLAFIVEVVSVILLADGFQKK